MALFSSLGCCTDYCGVGVGAVSDAAAVTLKDCSWQTTFMPGCFSTAHSAVLATGWALPRGVGCCPLRQWCGVVSGGLPVVLSSYSAVQGLQVVTCGLWSLMELWCCVNAWPRAYGYDRARMLCRFVELQSVVSHCNVTRCQPPLK